MKFEMEIGVPPLPAGPAKKLASALMPEGADDLVKAGRRLAGEMAFLAQCADLGTVRPSYLARCGLVVWLAAGCSCCGRRHSLPLTVVYCSPSFHVYCLQVRLVSRRAKGKDDF